MCEKPEKELEQALDKEEELIMQKLEQLDTLKPGEEVETVTVYFDPLELPTENLAELEGFDKDEFHRGLKEGSFFAGMYTALLNSGMSMEDAFSCIVNDLTYKMNVKIAELNSKATIEAGKNAAVAIEKQQL